MTTNPKAPKFRIRRASAQAPEGVDPNESKLSPPTEDGFGDKAFPGSAKAEADKVAEAAIAEIRREGLTGRQLRMARRLAQKQGLTPSSDFDAVRQLREMGIDPFDRSNMIALVHAKDGEEKEAERKAGAEVRAGLPQTVEPQPKTPGPRSDGPLGMHEVERIQRDIVRRRRVKTLALVARLSIFVLLPTIIAYIYFAFYATPSYGTKSLFRVQQAETQAVGGGGLLGGALATNQDSVAAQEFLTSREALQRLNDEHGYLTHFSDPSIDSLQRLTESATQDEMFKHYKGVVSVSFDQTEGLIRMEVSAHTPEMSRVFSEALISYAEERVDQSTERKRQDQMRGARDTFEEADARMIEAQQRVLELQVQMGILDPESESAGLMQQINTFEVQLGEKRLNLRQLLDNEQPNQARVSGLEGDIERLQGLIAELRSQLTVEGNEDESLASVSARLAMAETDLETRTMIMQEALQQMESARIEANRQVRFLSVDVYPVPPDQPTYPKVFENTLIAFFIFGAIYLLISVTVSILREQVSG